MYTHLKTFWYKIYPPITRTSHLKSCVIYIPTESCTCQKMTEQVLTFWDTRYSPISTSGESPCIISLLHTFCHSNAIKVSVVSELYQINSISTSAPYREWRSASSAHRSGASTPTCSAATPVWCTASSQATPGTLRTKNESLRKSRYWFWCC